VTRSLALIVGDSLADPILAPLCEGLADRSLLVRTVEPRDLAAYPITATEVGASVGGIPIEVALFRAGVDDSLSDSFAEGDRSFATNEVRSVWLHLSSLPAIRTVNRADPSSWFALSEWALWRRRFGEVGVPVAPLMVGDVEPPPRGQWVLWGGGETAIPENPAVRRSFGAALVPSDRLERSLWCVDRILSGPDGPAVQAASAVLRAHGVALADIGTDGRGRLWGATSRPVVPPDLAARVAELLAGYLVS
jgi:hypothetical protein